MVHHADRDSWIFNDNHTEDVRSFEYTLNFCGNVVNNPKPCAHRPDSGVAWRTNLNSSHLTDCTRLGGDFTKRPTPIGFKLFDEKKPSKGVVMTMAGGEKPKDCDRVAQLDVVHLCADRSFPPAGRLDETFVELVNNCEYRVFIPSLFGCPKECPVKHGRVCAGRGICSYDTDDQSTRCFCDTGHKGKDCSQSGGSGGGKGKIAGAVIGGMLIGITIVAGVYFFRHMRGGSAPEPEGYYEAAE